MKAFNFLFSERESKPRKTGLTMVLDKGLGLESARSLMEISGNYVDYLKFAWGTSAIHNISLIKEKVNMYRSFDIEPYTGGTLFEIAYSQNKIEDFFNRAQDLGFRTIEISNGSTDLSPIDKIDYIIQAKDFGFNVISEVGKKDPVKDNEITLDERIKQMSNELDAGSSKVIVEAREGGKNIGIFDSKGEAKEDEVDYILDNINSNDIMWEAPNKNQQVYFILKVGRDVNLGNISTDEITSLETIRLGLRGDTLGRI